MFVDDVTRSSHRETPIQRQLEDEFTRALLQKGYSVASRSDTEQIIRELRFQRESGYTDADAAELGRILNVSGVIIVSVTANDVSRESNEYTSLDGKSHRTYYYQGLGAASARLIEVRSSEILWQGSHSGVLRSEDESSAGNALVLVGGVLAGALPPRNGNPGLPPPASAQPTPRF
ncbi:MAG: hypothetical protein IT365_09035 [Candidatus Hydrogenedentes bacterium]|nr:hypothetical protein [Candidatus Hydrogenedentota bacterium]